MTFSGENAVAREKSPDRRARGRAEPALPFDAAAARRFGHAAAALRRHGREANARFYDVMIAATALAHGLPVHTCNPDDFTGIDGLEVVAVPLPTD